MRSLRRTTIWPAVLVAAGITASAIGCSSDSTSPQQQFPGSYSLRTVNGAALPYVFTSDTTGAYSVAADVFTFKSDGSFTEQETVTYTPKSGAVAQQSYSDAGSWALTGTALTITFSSDGQSTPATFSGGNTITITGQTTTGAPLTVVYQK